MFLAWCRQTALFFRVCSLHPVVKSVGSPFRELSVVKNEYNKPLQNYPELTWQCSETFIQSAPASEEIQEPPSLNR
jgi:hypothetical protein